MRYMIIEQFRNGDPVPVYARSSDIVLQVTLP